MLTLCCVALCIRGLIVVTPALAAGAKPRAEPVSEEIRRSGTRMGMVVDLTRSNCELMCLPENGASLRHLLKL